MIINFQESRCRTQRPADLDEPLPKPPPPRRSPTKQQFRGLLRCLGSTKQPQRRLPKPCPLRRARSPRLTGVRRSSTKQPQRRRRRPWPPRQSSLRLTKVRRSSTKQPQRRRRRPWPPPRFTENRRLSTKQPQRPLPLCRMSPLRFATR